MGGRVSLLTLVIIGLGGLFAGVTGPLLSAFVPPVVRDALGDAPISIGVVLAIDNMLLLLLVPWAGAASDRASARGSDRRRIVIAGCGLSAIGMLLFPFAAPLGLAAIVAVMVILYSGINIQRAPFQALVADLASPRDRSLANGSVTFQMCAGAIVFLMLGRMLGMQAAFAIAAAAVVIVAVVIAMADPDPAPRPQGHREAPQSLLQVLNVTLRGAVPGMRQIFVATLLLQLTFQTFTTWYTLHGTERFGVRPEDVTTGFIAWAVGGVIGAIPAGMAGVRFGRRNAMLLGFGLMTLSAIWLDRVTSATQAVPLLALASASWAFPMVNAYPLFIEPLPASSRGLLTAMFLLCNALGGGIGDPMNGVLFDLFGSYRPMFLMMSGYTVLAAAAVWMIPRGAGEARSS